MFVKNKEGEVKLPAPKEIPGFVQDHLIAGKKMDSDLARILKAVVYKNPKGEKTFNIRIFDEAEAGARKIQVQNYTSLDKHPDLIIYEGRFDEVAKQVELKEKKAIPEITILTEAEIQQKIEALSKPGSTVFFYQAREPAQGGPLGRGCAIIELSPDNGEKKGKKYTIYTADVVDMQPVDGGQKLFDSNKPKDVARWVKQAHHKRLY